MSVLKGNIKPISVGKTITYLCFLFAFLCFAVIGKNHEPFGLALLLSTQLCGLNPLACAILYLCSSLLSLQLSTILCYFLQGLVYYLFSFILNRNKKTRIIKQINLYCLCLLPFLFLGEFSTYAFLIVDNYLIQKIIIHISIVVCSVILNNGISCIVLKLNKCRLKTEELLSVVFLFFMVGLGFFNLSGEKIFFALSIYLIMVLSSILKSPSSLYISTGLALIQIICLGEVFSVFVYYICAIVGSIFANRKKVFYILGQFICLSIFVFLNCFISVENVSSIADFLSYNFLIKEIFLIVALLCYAFTPQKFIYFLKGTLERYQTKQIERLIVNRNRKLTGEKLYEISSIFREIENTFNSLCENENAELSVRQYMKGQVLANICDNCKGCFQKEGVDKCSQICENAIKKLIEIGCIKGKVNLVDLSKDITANCSNPSGILDEVNNQIKKYKQCMLEMENANAGRQVMAQNAKGLADILKNLAREQSNPFVMNAELENKIYERLLNVGIICSEVMVYSNGFESVDDVEDFTLNIIVNGKHNSKSVLSVCSNIVKDKLVVAEKIDIDANKVCYVIKKSPKFDAGFGVATISKEEEEKCGDTYSIIKINEGKFMVALSDGMGSGEKARRISENAISLIESFYKAQMSSSVIFNTVNKLLSFSSEEGFACIDVGVFDLNNGIADIIKIGSPIAVIFSEGKIKVIETNSLPLGILENLKPTSSRQNFSSGDMLVFMSDGITNAFDSTTEMFDFFKTCPTQNPQTLADFILNKALALYNNKPQDDVTVLTVRIFDN